MKLTYFDARGFGEVIRLLLKYGELEFDDVRINRATEWPNLKSSTPFGQVPILEENNKVVGQSLAIARYVAKKVNLSGGNDWEDLEIDAIVDTIDDLKIILVNVAHEKDAEVKENLKQTAIKETLPYYYEKFDKLAKENNGHLAINKLTLADFYFTAMHDIVFMVLGVDSLKNYPNLLNVINNVVDIPAVKAWVEARPEKI